MIELENMLADIAKSIVDDPSSVCVTKTENDNSITLNLTVAPDDMGKVIGKKGRIAKSIRTVVKTAATKKDLKVVVDIVE